MPTPMVVLRALRAVAFFGLGFSQGLVAMGASLKPVGQVAVGLFLVVLVVPNVVRRPKALA